MEILYEPDLNMDSVKHFKTEKVKNHFKTLEKKLQQDNNGTVLNQFQQNSFMHVLHVYLKEKLVCGTGGTDSKRTSKGPLEFWPSANVKIGPSIKSLKPWGPGSNPIQKKERKLKSRKSMVSEAEKKAKFLAFQACHDAIVNGGKNKKKVSSPRSEEKKSSDSASSNDNNNVFGMPSAEEDCQKYMTLYRATWVHDMKMDSIGSTTGPYCEKIKHNLVTLVTPGTPSTSNTCAKYKPDTENETSEENEDKLYMEERELKYFLEYGKNKYLIGCSAKSSDNPKEDEISKPNFTLYQNTVTKTIKPFQNTVTKTIKPFKQAECQESPKCENDVKPNFALYQNNVTKTIAEYKPRHSETTIISNCSKELQKLDDIINGRVTTPLAIADKERLLCLEDKKESKKIRKNKNEEREETVSPSSGPRMNARKLAVLQKKKESAARRLQGSIVEVVAQNNAAECEESIDETVPVKEVSASSQEIIIPDYNQDSDIESDTETCETPKAQPVPVRRHFKIKEVKKNRNIVKEEAQGWAPVLNKEQRKSKKQTLKKIEEKLTAELKKLDDEKKENVTVMPTPMRVPASSISSCSSSTSDKWSSEDENDSKNTQETPIKKGWNMSLLISETESNESVESKEEEEVEEIDMELVEPELLTWNVIPSVSDVEAEEWELC